VAHREKFQAIVTRITDGDIQNSELRGSVFFVAPDLYEDIEFPIPARPSFNFASANGAGFFIVPEVDDEIEIEVNIFDPASPYDNTHANNPDPVYVRMLYSEATPVAEEFLVNYGKRWGWKGKSGHLLLFDDTIGSELIRFLHTSGTKYEVDPSGNACLNGKLLGKFAIGNAKAELFDLIDQLIDVVDTTETDIAAITVGTALGTSSIPLNAASFIAHSATLQIIKTLLGEIKGELF